MDEYGEGLYPDLMFYYGVDLAKVVLGEGPAPSLVLALIQRLPEDSLTACLMGNAREWFGWSRSDRILADIFDALNINTRATGMWKGKPPEFPLQPRPTDRPAGEKPRVSVADIYKRISGGS